MKPNTLLFALITGVLSYTVSTLAGYELVSFGYWLISLSIIVVLNVIYFINEINNKGKQKGKKRWIKQEEKKLH